MGLFGVGKKDRTELTCDNIKFISSLTKYTEVLIAIVGEQSLEMREKLLILQDQIKYLDPSADRNVLAVEGKLENKLGDLKIALSKANASRGFVAANDLIEDCFILIAERKAK